MIMKDFDIVVVGGGHAGVECALAAARMGKSAAIVTQDAAKLALMSCNPAIGGIGKSHLVKEVDALGGVMGMAIDATGIQFRRLNLSRGPAVWSTRIQADRQAYNNYIVNYVENTDNVTVIEATADELLTDNGKISGVILDDNRKIECHCVILTTGTFLGGLIHIGQKTIKAGRMGERGAYKLSESLQSYGFEVGRLKTGTPPRLDGNTIDWSKCEVQLGEDPIPFFSHRSPKRSFEQSCCHLTYTSPETKRVISEKFKTSPMFSGQISSTGPRYCPSIEDKFFRFADKERHQIFLEPEGNGTSEIYPNGFSTALPEDVQRKAIKTIVGLEEVVMTKPGYAIEYDYCPAHQIKPSMETKLVSGLFFAGQINGTSGYEEAAGQGLIAGVNAVLYIEKEAPFIPDRSESYLGVMIDDLTTRSTTEPYRMFTSRAEYRLFLREDNARDRLIDYSHRLGLIDGTEYEDFKDLQQRTQDLMKSLKKERIKVADLGIHADRFKRVESINFEKLIKQPNISINEAFNFIKKQSSNGIDQETYERAATIIRYSGYIDKQQRQIDKFKKMESDKIPIDFDYTIIKGLKTEAKQKFLRFRPQSIGQAGRIEGVTPGDVAVLSIFLSRHNRSQRAQ